MRLKTLSVIVTCAFLLLVTGMLYVQVIKGPEYIALARSNRIRIVPIVAPRGDVYDRNGTIIVSSRTRFDCVAIPQEMTDKDRCLSAAARMLGTEKDKLYRRFKKGYLNPFTPIILARDISKEKAIEIEEERLNLPGIFISTRPVRDYLYRDACAHLVGYIGEIGPGELDRLDRYGYRMRDFIGKTGIEKEYDNYLRGTHGGMQVEVDNRGRQIRILSSKNPQRGKDIYLTIDMELQKYINEVFKDKKGACGVMDPTYGEMLGFVSKPAFDPNLFVAQDRRVRDLLKDKQRPLLDRAAGCAYPPGSSFKIVVATAGLQERKIKENTSFTCGGRHKVGGRVFRCWREKGHGPQDIALGIKNSCNVFFYNTGLLLGPDNIGRYAQRFGFGKPTGIDLPEEAVGLVPSRMWKKLSMGARWYDGETANYAIGQGYLLVTPLQILRMASLIANGGFLVSPHVVKRVESVEVSAETQRDAGISKAIIETVARGMQDVVEDDSGTGVRARVPGITIAGKTGTAQTGRSATHAWFTGFSSAEEPKVALVVFLEGGGKGGLNAAAMASSIFRKAKELNLL